ncbi:MAG: RHS repeat-associated core domain-containing protein [Gammaproteobacteria bacterium]
MYYRYDGLGRMRGRDVNGEVNRRFAYDPAGHLLADAGQETVWLGDIPVAVLSGTNTIQYVHADYLNTPRVITDMTGKVLWRWDSNAFGEGLPNEDVDGDGVKVTYNLRFPGQYYDKVTGKHYNYFRDYDPETGRYLESDPIGLAGGINTYAYVGGNPLAFIDPTGEIRIPRKWLECLVLLGCLHGKPEEPGSTRPVRPEVPTQVKPPVPVSGSKDPDKDDCESPDSEPAPKTTPTPMTPISEPSVPWWLPLIPLIPFPGNPIYGGL